MNGIALGVLELKRSTVSVAEGIRQNVFRLMDRHLPTWRRRRTELNAAPLARASQAPI